MRPQFSSNRIATFWQIQESVQALISGIPESGVVDLQPFFFRLTFDTTTFMLFGRSMSALTEEDVQHNEEEFAEAFNYSQEYLCHRTRFGKFYWLVTNSKFRKACRDCHRFVDGAVKRTLDESKSAGNGGTDAEKQGYVFLDALVRETRDPFVLRSQCLNLLLAGRDTTAATLSWTL